MNSNVDLQKKRFYLVTVDLLKGVAIFPMIIGHAYIWWDLPRVLNWEQGSLIIKLLVIFGSMVFPCFLFLLSFNQVNSFLIRRENSSLNELRIRTIKRGLVYIVVASLAQLIMALVISPSLIINFLLTWQLFHLFSFSTFFLLVILEIAWRIESRYNRDLEHVSTFLLLVTLLFLFVFFLIFHNYSGSRQVVLPVSLHFISIIEHALFDFGTCPIIPWFSFSLIGGLTALVLDLPNSKYGKTQNIKGAGLLMGGFLIFLVGLWFLSVEEYTNAIFNFPASTSFVLITNGVLLVSINTMIRLFDGDHKQLRRKAMKLGNPIIVVSKITLTIYFIHNIAFILDPSIIDSEAEVVLFLLAFIYSLFFVLIAYYWKRVNFKYSLEWMIVKFS
ncbi:MAG: hypothetical protein ACXAC8_09410 [Candidatus Hodarchaeales archaeon]|jgi:hypothetical protein